VIPNLAQLAERARISAERPALFSAGRVIDYRELARRADETERGLEALGIRSGDVAAVLLENGLAFAEILHAVAQRGVTLHVRLADEDKGLDGSPARVVGPSRRRKSRQRQSKQRGHRYGNIPETSHRVISRCW